MFIVVVWKEELSDRRPFHSIEMAEDAFDAAKKADGVTKVELFLDTGLAEELLKEWHRE